MRKPRALHPGDRVAVVAPASGFAPEEFDAGVGELKRLGFDPVYDDTIFDRRSYVAGPAEVRAHAWRRAWADPSIATLIAVRGGYGSVQLLPFLERDAVRRTAKVFIGYSDNTSLLSWLTTRCGV